MSTRKLLTVIVSATIAVALLLGACTKQAPTPSKSPAPAPTAPAKTTDAPKPAPVGSPAASPKPTAAKPAVAGQTLTVAVAGWGNDTWAPSTAQGENRFHWDLMYSNLMTFSKERKMVPSLASSWESSKDGMTWTINLRKDAKFHDGAPVTAEDVKYSIEDAIIKDSISTGAPLIRQSLKSIEVVDPYKLVLNMKQPTMQSGILTPIARYVPIVPKKVREQVGKEAYEKKPVGSGAYRLVEHKLGDYFKFEAFDGYWGPKPAFQTVIIRNVPEEATRVAMLKKGEADIINLTLSSKKEIEGAGFDIRAAKNTFVNTIVFEGLYNKDRATFDAKNPFLDVRVRKALNLAINRDEIVKQIYFGSAIPAGNYPFMPDVEGWNDAWKPLPYDPAQAKKLLADAGYGSGFKATMYLFEATGAPDLPVMAEAVAMYWANIGIKVEFQKTTWAALKGTLQARKASGTLVPRRGDAFEDVLSRLNTEVSSWSVTGAYEDPATDATIKKIGGTLDFTERDKLSRDLGQVFYDNYATAPVAYVDMLYAVGKRLGAWEPLPFASVLNLQSAKPK